MLKKRFLLKDYGFNKTEIVEIYEAMDMFKSTQLTSVYDLLKLEQENDRIRHITLLSTAFDSILGGWPSFRAISSLWAISKFYVLKEAYRWVKSMKFVAQPEWVKLNCACNCA